MGTRKTIDPPTVGVKIKAVAPWFGGKRKLMPVIREEFGKHRAYWSLCCGSFTDFLIKEPATMETAIDMHGDLTNLAFVLQDSVLASELYGKTAATLLSREIFLKSADIIRYEPVPENLPDVDRAYHYFVVSWSGRNGASRTLQAW